MNGLGDVNPPVHAWSTISPTMPANPAWQRAISNGWRKSFRNGRYMSPGGLNRKDRMGKERLRRRVSGPRQFGVFEPPRPLPPAALSNRRPARLDGAVCRNMMEIAAALAGGKEAAYSKC